MKNEEERQMKNDSNRHHRDARPRVIMVCTTSVSFISHVGGLSLGGALKDKGTGLELPFLSKARWAAIWATRPPPKRATACFALAKSPSLQTITGILMSEGHSQANNRVQNEGSRLNLLLPQPSMLCSIY